MIIEQHIKKNGWLTGAAALAFVPAGIVSLAVSIASRCALVAKASCGAASARALVSLAARLHRLASSIPDNDVSSLGSAAAAAFYVASLNSVGRSSGVAVSADSRLLCDIEECVSAFDSIRSDVSFQNTRYWSICFEAQSIVVLAYETAFSVAPGKASRDERMVSCVKNE